MRGLARDGTRWPSGARSRPSQAVQVVGSAEVLIEQGSRGSDGVSGLKDRSMAGA